MSNRLAVLISGRGSNMEAIVRAAGSGRLQAQVVGVISNRSRAAGLDFAGRAAIPTRVVRAADHPGRDAYDQALDAEIRAWRADYVALAGFMRILGPGLVDRWHGRLLNIHPSLLPAYKGLDTHERVLAAGDGEHGASVHFVSAELDGGPVIARARLKVNPDDDPDSLAARVLRLEHQLYPAVLNLLCTGRLSLERNRIMLDHNPLTQPLELEENGELR